MKHYLLSLFALTAALTMQAQDIKLPPPNQNETSMSVVKALATRHSVRSYDSKDLTTQQLSNLCWAAFGQSRDDKHRTAPTAMNKQEIRLYAFTAKGVYEYDAKVNTLVQKAKGDHRQLMAKGQAFAATAPVSLLMVIDLDLFGSDSEHAIRMGCVDAGNVSENINLYCQSVGLATVPRATHDTEGIKKLLNLTDKQIPIMNNPVGYEKK